MPSSSVPDSWLASEDSADPEIRVLLADHDPISRHVVGSVLRHTGRLRVVACLDGQRPLREWPLSRVDLVILVPGLHEDFTRIARDLVARQIKVLLIGTGWSRQRMDAAFASGVAGCLVKDPRIGRLAAAAGAVADGYTVLSPELLTLYTATRHPVLEPGVPTPGGQAAADLLCSLTDREHKVLALLACGMSTAEAAAALVVSPATIKSHISHSLAKLGVRNRLEAVLLMRHALDTDRMHVSFGA